MLKKNMYVKPSELYLEIESLQTQNFILRRASVSAWQSRDVFKRWALKYAKRALEAEKENEALRENVAILQKLLKERK